MSDTPLRVMPEGWAFPDDALAFHYFVGGRSLCGKWAYEGRNLSFAREPVSGECRSCSHLLAQRLKETR